MENNASTRRAFLGAIAAAAGSRIPAGAAPPPARTAMGLSPDCFVIARPPREAYEYLQYAWERGAGGVQSALTSFEPEYLKKVRARAEQLGMYLEITTAMPKDDSTEQFERVVQAAREAGARCLRSVCLGGRRYETFSTLEDWKAFVADAHARLARTARLVEKYRFPIGIENHKDWTAEEMAPLMNKYGSDYLGVCYDWGNNLSLLDDAMEITGRLAPYVMNCHIKDMAVEEYPEGFLLAEVPLGQGLLDLKRMTAIVLKARPNARFSLDMLTRDPLKIPCLTEKYWVTFTDRNGRYLARALSMVRANKPRQPIPYVTKMSREEALQLEQQNVRLSVEYARDQLGLRAA